MKISSITNYNKSFKGAHININALSDTHGELMLANNALEEMRERKDIFYKDEKGKANILAICGDWFIDGGRKGFISNPQKPLAMFQMAILNSFIKYIKRLAPQDAVLFTPGNHEFDCTLSLLDKILPMIDADITAVNIDLKNSPALEQSRKLNKISRKKIIEVDDDKDENLKHKVLVLGVAPVNLPAYQKNLEGLSLIDSINKPQMYVEKEDYKKTFEAVTSEIDDFKKKNPKGIVVVLCHTGAEFADNLARESNIDIIFDGHEHRTNTRYVNKTPIIPLSQNFRKIANAKLNINDNGDLTSITIKDINPLSNRKTGPLKKMYENMFKDDIKKVYTIKSKNPDIKELSMQGIRIGNNYLSNFITDIILGEIRKIKPETDFFALNSSSVRHSLPAGNEKNTSFFDIKNLLTGIREEEAQIMTTKVTGSELAYLIADNFLFNREMPEKNSLIQYSGLFINRTAIMKNLSEGKKSEDLTKYIIDKRTNRPIEKNRYYIIANPQKYFDKSQNPEIKELKKRSEYLGCSVNELFSGYFKNSGIKEFEAECDVRII